MLKGMDRELARKYVEVMEQIEKIADHIYALGYMMSFFEEIEEGTVEIKPFFIGTVGKSIAEDVLKITSLLDNDFVSVLEARQLLEE
jgi:hypothetical protein